MTVAGETPQPALEPIPIPPGTRRLLATMLMQHPSGPALLLAFGDDHGAPAEARYTLVIDEAHLEPAPQPPG